jgi:hypothetical protein
MTPIWRLNGFPNPIVLAIVVMTQVVRQRRGFHLIKWWDLRVSQAFERAQNAVCLNQDTYCIILTDWEVYWLPSIA